jgi:hypothetical protein
MNAPADINLRRLRRIRWLVALFILGLVLSGATAIPLETELNWLVNFTGARTRVELPGATTAPAWAEWLCRVQAALQDTNAKYPFIGYGGDWLAFGHFAIAIAFIGAWRDPVRNTNMLFNGMEARASRKKLVEISRRVGILTTDPTNPR